LCDMQRLVCAAVLCVAHVAADIPEAMLGTWKTLDHATTHAIIGPSVLLNTLRMSKDHDNGDYWFSGIDYGLAAVRFGQVFRIRGNKMQYCFAHLATSPFDVNTTDANRVVFCYQQGKRMRSHRAGKTGCDAAQIILELDASTGVLTFTFMMSPPVKHAWVQFKRTGPPPPVSFYKVSNIYGACDPLNPGAPTAVTSPSDASAPQILCPVVAKRSSLLPLSVPDVPMVGADGGWACRQLDGLQSFLLPKEKVDIRLQHKQSMISCWPCKVSYSISAAIPEDQYISVGFKGLAYRALPGKERPNYFGMSTDEIDDKRTTGVIVLGYSGCVREMKAESYVGTPTDVNGNPHLSGASVKRQNGRTVVRFTIEQHAGRSALEINTFFNQEQVSMRVMWAIGGIGGDGGCEAPIQMHTKRGVSPLGWFSQNPVCVLEAELGSNATTTVVV